MNTISPTAAAPGGGFPTEDDIEVAGIMLSVPVLIERYSFSWGSKKKRSVLDLKSEPEEAKRSPTTPLNFLPSGSGSDGGGCHRKLQKSGKRKATDDLVKEYNRIQQEREILVKKIKAMETRHQLLTCENVELKARREKINYPRNMENFHIWSSSMKAVGQQNYPPQPINMFGLVNQIDPRVKIHKEHYDYLASSHPLDQTRYLMIDTDLRAKTAAAAARKRRMLRMKENKNSVKIHEEHYDYVASSQPLDQSRYVMVNIDPRAMIAAAARKRRMLRMKESKKSLMAMKLSRACR